MVITEPDAGIAHKEAKSRNEADAVTGEDTEKERVCEKKAEGELAVVSAAASGADLSDHL